MEEIQIEKNSLHFVSIEKTVDGSCFCPVFLPEP